MANRYGYYRPFWVKWNEEEELAKAFRDKLKLKEPEWNDPEDLSEIPNYEVTLIDGVVERLFDRKLARGKKKLSAIHKPHLDSWSVDMAYVPRGKNTTKRLQLSPDLAHETEPFPVPVFCDIGRESNDVIFTPDFRYITKNIYRDQHVFTKHRKLSYRCKCPGECRRGSCECVQLHHAVNGERVTNMMDGRVKVDKPVADMYTYALIACGPMCGCPKTCPNRMENLTVKNRFEIFRRHDFVGFGVRTLNSIKLGEMVMEFAGRVMPDEHVNTDSRRLDYAMELYDGVNIHKGQTEPDYVHFHEVLKEKTKHFFTEHEEHYWDYKMGTAFVDPYTMGNLARFLSYGCYPNLMPIRVIANYLHPQLHHIWFYAVNDISAGSELFFNYGLEYKKRNQFKCLCGTPFCQSHKGSMEWMQIPKNKVAPTMAKLHEQWRIFAKEKDEKMRQSLPAPGEPDWITLSDSEDEVEEIQKEHKEIAETNHRYYLNPVRDEELETDEDEEPFGPVWGTKRGRVEESDQDAVDYEDEFDNRGKTMAPVPWDVYNDEEDEDDEPRRFYDERYEADERDVVTLSDDDVEEQGYKDQNAADQDYHYEEDDDDIVILD